MRIASILSLAVLLAGSARAQPAPGSREEATRLFEEGRTLAGSGDYDAACDRFARSFALVPAPGTQLNLADCSERQGHLAEAWHMFEQVAADAERTGNTSRVTYARGRADKLVPKLTIVILNVGHAELRGLAITINGRGVPAAARIREVVDPGAIAVAATAPQSSGFARAARGVAGTTVEVDVPPLDRPSLDPPAHDPPAHDPPAHPEPADAVPHPAMERRRSRVHLAWGLAGAAGASAIAGIAILAIGRQDYAAAAADSSHCSQTADGLFCDAAGSTQIRHAQALADTSTGLAIVSGALIAVAAGVYFTAPHDSAIVPVVGANGAGLAVAGSF